MMNSSKIMDTKRKNAYFEKTPFAQNQQSKRQKWPFLTGHKKLVMHAIPIFFLDMDHKLPQVFMYNLKKLSNHP